MAKVKYKEISKELLRMVSPLENDERSFRSSLNNSIDVVEHYLIDIDKLIPYKKQARREFNQQEIEGLAQSIKEHGVRQPLTVIQSSQDSIKYEVVSGERRLRAAKIAGLYKVPCIIISDSILAEEIALVENIQRQDLHPIELGEAFLKILESRKGLSQIALSDKLGIPNRTISEVIQYTNLSNDVKEFLVNNNIKKREFLRKLIKSDNPQTLIKNKALSNQSLKNNVRSIIRVNLEGDNFFVQAKSISNLDKNKKEELKKILNNLITDL